MCENQHRELKEKRLLRYEKDNLRNTKVTEAVNYYTTNSQDRRLFGGSMTIRNTLNNLEEMDYLRSLDNECFVGKVIAFNDYLFS